MGSSPSFRNADQNEQYLPILPAFFRVGKSLIETFALLHIGGEKRGSEAGLRCNKAQLSGFPSAMVPVFFSKIFDKNAARNTMVTRTTLFRASNALCAEGVRRDESVANAL